MKKNVDTKKLVIGCAVLVVFVVICSFIWGNAAKQPLSDKFDEDTVIAEAERAIGYFNDRDYQSIIDMGEVMAQSITVEEFAQQCDGPLDECGAFVKIEKVETVGATDEETGAEYGGAVIVAKYEKSKIQFSIGFDEKMQLIQFIIR